jgi:hypothetical protein
MELISSDHRPSVIKLSSLLTSSNSAEFSSVNNTCPDFTFESFFIAKFLTLPLFFETSLIGGNGFVNVMRVVNLLGDLIKPETNIKINTSNNITKFPDLKRKDGVDLITCCWSSNSSWVS